MSKGDIQLPNESGTTDLRSDREVSTGNSKSPTKTVYYRGSVIPHPRAGESVEDFAIRGRKFAATDKTQARRAASKSRSMSSRGGR